MDSMSACEVLDRLATVLAVRVVLVHVGRHRARTVERHERRDVVEADWSERPHQRPHRAALQLEDPDTVTASQHCEDLVVVEREVVDVRTGPGDALDQVEGALDHREVPQPEEVHLQKAELLDPVHLVLGDEGRQRGFLPALGLSLDGQVLGERIAGDDHCGSVDTVLAAQVLESSCHVHHTLGLGVAFVHRTQVGRSHVTVLVTLFAVETRMQWGVATHDERRHCLCDLVPDYVRETEHPRRIAHRCTGLDRRERDDLCDMVRPVAL